MPPIDGAPTDAGPGDGSFALDDSVMSSDFDEIELPAEGEETPPSDGGTGGTSQPTPAQGAPQGQQGTPQQQTQVAPQGAQPPGQQAPAQQTTVQPQGQAPVSTGQEGQSRAPMGPGELATALGQNRDKIVDVLAAQKFQLTPAEIQALEVDAVGVLPKIMAKVYYEATVNNLQQMANLIPRMVEHVANERITENAAEASFHKEWPNINANDPQQMRAVQHFAMSYRSMNPRASQADAIRFVGQAVTQYFNLPAPQRAAAPAGQQRGGQPQRRGAPPFAPAAGGRAQPTPGMATGAPANPFDGLGFNFDE